MRDLPQPGIEPVPHALGVWSLNHWTAREVPGNNFNYGKSFMQKDVHDRDWFKMAE